MPEWIPHGIPIPSKNGLWRNAQKIRTLIEGFIPLPRGHSPNAITLQQVLQHYRTVKGKYAMTGTLASSSRTLFFSPLIGRTLQSQKMNSPCCFLSAGKKDNVLKKGLVVTHARRHAAHSTHAARGHAATFGHRALGRSDDIVNAQDHDSGFRS